MKCLKDVFNVRSIVIRLIELFVLRGKSVGELKCFVGFFILRSEIVIILDSFWRFKKLCVF